MERELIKQQPKSSFQGKALSDKGIWRRKAGKMSKNPTPKLTSELQWAVAVPGCLFSQGSLALRFTFQYDFYEECPAPAALSWAHSLIQSSYSWGEIWELFVLGAGCSCHAPWLLLQCPCGSIPGGLCWGCAGAAWGG